MIVKTQNPIMICLKWTQSGHKNVHNYVVTIQDCDITMTIATLYFLFVTLNRHHGYHHCDIIIHYCEVTRDIMMCTIVTSIIQWLWHYNAWLWGANSWLWCHKDLDAHHDEFIIYDCDVKKYNNYEPEQ